MTDAATVLSIIAGPDPLDNATLVQPLPVPDFTKALTPNALRGARLGVPRAFQSNDPNIMAAFNASIDIIRGLGAVVVDPAEFPDAQELLASDNETTVLNVDFKVSPYIYSTLVLNQYMQVDVNSYIAGLLEVPTGVTDLADLIAFNTAHADEELIPPFYTDQSQ